MSKGTNVSFNLPDDLWEKLLTKGNPGEQIVAAVECYLGGDGACVAPAEAEKPALVKDVKKA